MAGHDLETETPLDGAIIDPSVALVPWVSDVAYDVEEAPSQEAIVAAQDFIEEASDHGFEHSYSTPLESGGIELCFSTEEYRFLAFIYNDGEVLLDLVTKSGDKSRERVLMETLASSGFAILGAFAESAKIA